jgi:hypothetical protein
MTEMYDVLSSSDTLLALLSCRAREGRRHKESYRHSRAGLHAEGSQLMIMKEAEELSAKGTWQ